MYFNPSSNGTNSLCWRELKLYLKREPKNPTITIQEGSLALNEYVGYKFDSIVVEDSSLVNEGNTVSSGTVITINYIKDETQTKDLTYTSKHVVDGQEQVSDTKTYTSSIWVNEPTTTLGIVNGSLDANTYEGYTFVGIDVKPDTTSVADGTVITLTYEKTTEPEEPTTPEETTKPEVTPTPSNPEKTTKPNTTEKQPIIVNTSDPIKWIIMLCYLVYRFVGSWLVYS